MALEEVGRPMYRAKCTRCVPEWLGPVHSLEDFAAHHPESDPIEARREVATRAALDVRRHVDRRHYGRLR